jgi:hypothetical protein
MGTYTELVCAFALHTNTPHRTLDLLLYMTGLSDAEPSELPDHPLFNQTRWAQMLQSDSVFFEGDARSVLRLEEFDGQHRVTIRCNFKNYDDEIAKFIDWITPCVDALPGDFLGYSRAETTEVPTLLFHPALFITPQIPEGCLGSKRSIPTRE